MVSVKAPSVQFNSIFCRLSFNQAQEKTWLKDISSLTYDFQEPLPLDDFPICKLKLRLCAADIEDDLIDRWTVLRLSETEENTEEKLESTTIEESPWTRDPCHER